MFFATRVIPLRSLPGPGRAQLRLLSTAPDVDVSLSTSAASPGITFLSLCRPKAKNAISMSLLAQLRANLELIRSRFVVVPPGAPLAR